MIVEEIFDSIQGEGVYIGTPTTFVRFVGCNQHCSFCDTGYGSDKARTSKRMDASMIASAVLALNNRHVVLTGGEPMIQPTAELAELVDRLLVLDCFVTVETNGTIVPGEEFIKKVDLFSISPKLASAGNDKGFEELSANLFSYHIRGANMSVKFVVDMAEKDELEVMRYFDFFKKQRITDFPIIIQPRDGKIDDLVPVFNALHPQVKRTRLAVRFLPQLHKAIGVK